MLYERRKQKLTITKVNAFPSREFQRPHYRAPTERSANQSLDSNP